jgi:cytochrome oxidase assembly protein ShyY1
LIVAVPIGFAICLMLSDWQWNRYEGRKDANVVQSANMALPAASAQSVMPPGTEVTDANRWRTVTATGQYVPSAQVLVRKRPLDSAIGFWVVTPLATSDKTVVVVNRGWIRADADAKSSPNVPPPPTGQVTVEGRVQPSTPAPSPAPNDLPTGQVGSLDVSSIGRGVGEAVLPGYVELTTSTPPQAAGLTPIPAPEISEGPHLSYSMQWIAFAIMFIVGLIILLRRELQVRRRESELIEESADDSEPPSDTDSDTTQPGEPTRLPQDSHP